MRPVSMGVGASLLKWEELEHFERNLLVLAAGARERASNGYGVGQRFRANHPC